MLALRERNFRLYWFGQAVSNIGNWMQVVALGWFVLQINGSPLALGFLGLAQSLPLFTLSLAGGMLADRFPRLKLLIVTQSLAMVLAFVLALLASSGKPPLWSLLLVAALAASVTAIDNPARQAFLSDLVSKDALLNAIALNASVYNGAAVIGPSLAGLLLLSIGATGCFLLNAVSFLAVLLALIMLARAKVQNQDEANEQGDRQNCSHYIRSKHSIHTNKVEKRNRSIVGVALAVALSGRRTILSGGRAILVSFRAFGLLRHERAILAVLGIAATASLLGRPYLLLMPAFARTVQHVGPSGLGIMVAASGAGSFIGSLLLASLKSFQRLDRLLAICGVGFGLVLAIFALMHSFIAASLMLIVCGAAATMTMNVANTQLQTSAPAGMRGRVMSLYTLIAAGFTPLGALLVSGLSTYIGLQGATLAAALGVIVSAFLF